VIYDGLDTRIRMHHVLIQLWVLVYGFKFVPIWRENDAVNMRFYHHLDWTRTEGDIVDARNGLRQHAILACATMGRKLIYT
jgi:hypothetical protein